MVQIMIKFFAEDPGSSENIFLRLNHGNLILKHLRLLFLLLLSGLGFSNSQLNSMNHRSFVKSIQPLGLY